MRSFIIILAFAAFFTYAFATPANIQPLTEIQVAGFEETMQPFSGGCPDSRQCDMHCRRLGWLGGWCQGFRNMDCMCYR